MPSLAYQYVGTGRQLVDIDGSLILLLTGSVLRTTEETAHTCSDIRRLIGSGQLVRVEEADHAH
ncbi:hypothetical protein MASR1M60_22700 [Rhodocyclaceae bacterium]